MKLHKAREVFKYDPWLEKMIREAWQMTGESNRRFYPFVRKFIQSIRFLDAYDNLKLGSMSYSNPPVPPSFPLLMVYNWCYDTYTIIYEVDEGGVYKTEFYGVNSESERHETTTVGDALKKLLANFQTFDRKVDGYRIKAVVKVKIFGNMMKGLKGVTIEVYKIDEEYLKREGITS